MSASVGSRLLTFLQRLVPARLLARLVYRLSRLEHQGVKNVVIRGFSWLYNVNVAEAAKQVPDEYASFNEFFTRELKADARPVVSDSHAICCPADGTVAQISHASHGKLVQAKGITYELKDLLADADCAVSLRNSAFTTIYLAPYNYHRVHMPLDGVLEHTAHIPGKLFSVNAATTESLDGLYVRNERLVCQFTGEYGRFAVVLVGAMNVGSFSTAWAGELGTSPNGVINRNFFAPDNKPPAFKKGDYLGHFNLGSTVIFIAPPVHLTWATEFAVGTTVRMGQGLGQFTSPAAA